MGVVKKKESQILRLMSLVVMKVDCVCVCVCVCKQKKAARRGKDRFQHYREKRLNVYVVLCKKRSENLFLSPILPRLVLLKSHLCGEGYVFVL